MQYRLTIEYTQTFPVRSEETVVYEGTDRAEAVRLGAVVLEGAQDNLGWDYRTDPGDEGDVEEVLDLVEADADAHAARGRDPIPERIELAEVVEVIKATGAYFGDGVFDDQDRTRYHHLFLKAEVTA